jgi:hypothetical protein
MVPNVMRDSEAKRAIQLFALRQKITAATATHTTVETQAIESRQIAKNRMEIPLPPRLARTASGSKTESE